MVLNVSAAAAPLGVNASIVDLRPEAGATRPITQRRTMQVTVTGGVSAVSVPGAFVHSSFQQWLQPCSPTSPVLLLPTTLPLKAGYVCNLLMHGHSCVFGSAPAVFCCTWRSLGVYHRHAGLLFAVAACAGTNVSMVVTASNTGNLILRNSSLTSTSTQGGITTGLALNCTQFVDVPVDGQLRCTAVSHFDQDGMELGDRTFDATGESFTLETATNQVAASPNWVIDVQEATQLIVDVLGAECTRPARMREYTHWGPFCWQCGLAAVHCT